MPTSLDALKKLAKPTIPGAPSLGAAMDAGIPDPAAALATLHGGQPSSEFTPSSYTFEKGMTRDDLATPFEQAQTAQASAADARDRDALAKILQTNAEVTTANRPDVSALADQAQKEKIQLEQAGPQATAAGNLAVEQAKIQGASQLKAQEQKGTQDLIEQSRNAAPGGTGAPGSGFGPGESLKPAINANGGVSFTVSTMPALVQRAHSQLSDARNKTTAALEEAERMYPGINDAAEKADQTTSGSTGWGSFLSGLGAPKYGSATDMAGAANERLKYTLGIPSAFSKLAQESSFGNIEQMAGQLPGVRGLATITPLFKEHQSRWGHETPLATVQRLRHMGSIMDDTLHNIEQPSQ